MLAAKYPRRYRTLDAWRGVAALMILFWHRFHLRGGHHLWLGVQIYFVISGYCLAAAAFSSAERGTPTRTFFGRRVRRIWPPYLASLFFALAMAHCATIPGAAEPASTVMRYVHNLTMTQWFPPARLWWGTGIGMTQPWWNPVLILPVHWSLDYEEQFYALFGVAIALHRWLPVKWFLVVVTMGVASFNLTHPALVSGLFMDFWLQFACGALLYYRLCEASERVGQWLDVACATALVAIGLVAVTAGELPLLGWPTRYEFWGQLFMCGSFAALLRVLRPADEWLLQRRLSWPFMRAGTISYSLYLVHWPILDAVYRAERGVPTLRGDVLGLGSAVVAAYVFFRVFEKPFLNPPMPVPERSRAEPEAGATIAA